MTQIIQGLREIAARYDAAFVDLWGCLHNGVKAFPYAVEALMEFRLAGKKVMLLTNAPRPRRFIREQLDKLGVPQDAYDDITTSGDSAQAAMFSGLIGTKLYHIGAPKDEGFFTDMAQDIKANAKQIERVPLEEAEGIVCTGLFDDLTETPEDYKATLLYGVNEGLDMLVANPDIVVDLGERRIYCAGAIGEAYSKAGGKCYYFGKPHPPIYDLARRRLIADSGLRDDASILCIGDGINTDVKGGLGENLDTLFLTNGLAAQETGSTEHNLDETKLKTFLEAHKMSPSYAIPVLKW